MVTTALLRRKDCAPHSSCLELTVHENSDITQVKGRLTGRASASLEEVKLDLSGLFHHNHRNKKLRKLFKALADLPHLKTLRFHYNSSSSSTTTTTTTNTTTTTVLERLPVHLLTIALSGGSGSGSSKLEILELNHVNLTGAEEEFRSFLATLRTHASLQVFRFSSSGCSSASSINDLLLALSVSPKLEKVVLHSEEGRSPWGRLCGDAVGSLCRSPTLKDFQHLVLYDSSALTGNFFSDEHTIALAQALSSSSSLSVQPPRHYDNNHNNMTTDTTTLHENNSSSRLEELMISCWPLGQAGVQSLCGMIQNNTSLRKFTMVIYELDEDNNTEETCNLSELANALQFNSTLKVLELHGGNEIGKWIEEAFLIMMQSNYSLTHLKLFHDDALFLKPYLNFYLKLNRAGRGRLLRNDNASRDQWVDSLIQVRNDLSCIFYLLSLNPLLFCDRHRHRLG